MASLTAVILFMSSMLLRLCLNWQPHTAFPWFDYFKECSVIAVSGSKVTEQSELAVGVCGLQHMFVLLNTTGIRVKQDC